MDVAEDDKVLATGDLDASLAQIARLRQWGGLSAGFVTSEWEQLMTTFVGQIAPLPLSPSTEPTIPPKHVALERSRFALWTFLFGPLSNGD